MNVIERAADIVLINNLYAQLAQAADHGTLDEYRSLWTEDGVWEAPPQDPVGLPAQKRVGIDDVIAGAAERREAGMQGPGTNTWHVVSNVHVSPEADQADATAYYFYYVDTISGPRLLITGRYHDRFTRTADGWLLAHRRIGPA